MMIVTMIDTMSDTMIDTNTGTMIGTLIDTLIDTMNETMTITINDKKTYISVDAMSDTIGCPMIDTLNTEELLQSNSFISNKWQNIKALDGIAIESAEGGTAKDTFGGRLTMDFVAERYNNTNCADLRELDFPNCSIRHVDLGNGQVIRIEI